MLILSPTLKYPFFSKQKSRHDGHSGSSNDCLDKLKSSFNDFFAGRKKIELEDRNPETSSLPERNVPAAYQPHFNVKIIIVDPEVLEALQAVYEALHDPSILDAKRHQRYDLYPPFFAETPQFTQDIINITAPRCSRSSSNNNNNNSDTHDTSSAVLHLAKLVRPPAPLQGLFPPITDAPRVMIGTDIKIIRFLGEGTTGQVYFVKDRISKARVALKVVPKEGKNDYTLSVIQQERDISQKLSDSPWFVNLYCSWHDHDHMYIAMTAYPTDLDTEMIRLDKLEPYRARFYMAELIIALTELHSRGIVHRDIKAPNILIDREGHIVLADFGLSNDFRQIPSIAERVYQPYWPFLPHDNPTSESEPRDPHELHFVAWDYRGSELEMAPEIHLRQPYSFGVDFWSAAVVLYWMLTGRPPWYEDEEEFEDEAEDDVKPVVNKIVEDDLYWDPGDDVDEVTKDFLERMLAKDPKKRLMISYEIPNHPYFAGINWPLMEARKVPVPWIPESEICHVYEPTSPTFTPGKPYYKDEYDPYPEFTYFSMQARRRINYEQDDSDDSDSDAESACTSESLTDITQGDEDAGRHPNMFFFDASLDDHDSCQDRNDHDNSTLRVDSINDDTPLKEGWDVTIVSRPPTSPYGPGPKSWLHAQDLLRICASDSGTIASSVTSTTFSLEVTCLTPEISAFDVKIASPACPPSRLRQSFTPDSSRPSVPQQATRVVNGKGFLFKVKVWWMSKLWTPKPKKALGVKRLSLLN